MAKINKLKESLLPQNRLKEMLIYYPETGIFIWNERRRGRKFGQIAGNLNKVSGYVCIVIDGNNYLAHRLAWLYVHGDFPSGEQSFIDHINGKKGDNRIVNLRKASHKENHRNKPITSNNSSGITGVTREKRVVRDGVKIYVYYYWRAHWYNENGKQLRKDFSIHKLGETEAKSMAITYRTEQLLLLNRVHGIIYSNRHGT